MKLFITLENHLKPIPKKDWSHIDQGVWERAGVDERIKIVKEYKANTTDGVVGNSFIDAVFYNSKKVKGYKEYKNIKERNLFYSVVAYMLFYSGGYSKSMEMVRFFAAAKTVTGPGAVQEVNGLIVRIFYLNSQTVKVLTDINELLFKVNMPILNKVLNQWVTPRSPFNNKKLHPFYFDLAMTIFEQSHVEYYLKKNQKQITADVAEDFVENLMDVNAFEVKDTPLHEPMKWAVSALQKSTINGFGKLRKLNAPNVRKGQLDYTVFKHRIYIAMALIFILHGKKYMEYELFVRNLKELRPKKI